MECRERAHGLIQPTLFITHSHHHLRERAEREALRKQRVSHALRLLNRARFVPMHTNALRSQNHILPSVEGFHL